MQLTELMENVKEKMATGWQRNTKEKADRESEEQGNCAKIKKKAKRYREETASHSRIGEKQQPLGAEQPKEKRHTKAHRGRLQGDRSGKGRSKFSSFSRRRKEGRVVSGSENAGPGNGRLEEEDEIPKHAAGSRDGGVPEARGEGNTKKKRKKEVERVPTRRRSVVKLQKKWTAKQRGGEVKECWRGRASRVNSSQPA